MPFDEQPTPRAEGPAGPPAANGDPPRVTAVLLGGSDETRLLLRGLLRLQHHRVVAEHRTASELPEDPGDGTPRILVLVVDGEGEEWRRELSIARRLQPTLQAILVIPDANPELTADATRLGVRAVLIRPFAVRELVRAVEAVARGESPPASGASAKSPRRG